MKILFISLSKIESFEDEGIYSDLLHEFIINDHEVTVITPDSEMKERHLKIKSLKNNIIKIKVPQVSGLKSKIVKGINTVLFPHILWNRMKSLINVKKFDLVIYPTPPISIERIIQKIKKTNKNIQTFLLLKDIFPQNAVDLEYFSKSSIIFKYFRKQEMRLYNVSDSIGCMSQGNRQFILKNNEYLAESDITIVPNSISINRVCGRVQAEVKQIKRNEFQLPIEKKIIVYAGNLGKPQSIDFLIESLEKIKESENFVHFAFCGSGTDANKLKKYCIDNPTQCSYYGQLSKLKSDELISISDYGLILLDARFTIPNIPSRMLSYMKFGLPLIALTDINTDIKDTIIENNLGYWAESRGEEMKNIINSIHGLSDENYVKSSNCVIKYVKDMCNTEKGYKEIIKQLK